MKQKVITGNYILNNTDYDYLLISNGATITCGPNFIPDFKFKIKCIGNSVIQSSNMINGRSSINLLAGNSCSIYRNGINWNLEFYKTILDDDLIGNVNGDTLKPFSSQVITESTVRPCVIGTNDLGQFTELGLENLYIESNILKSYSGKLRDAYLNTWTSSFSVASEATAFTFNKARLYSDSKYIIMGFVSLYQSTVSPTFGIYLKKGATTLTRNTRWAGGMYWYPGTESGTGQNCNTQVGLHYIDDSPGTNPTYSVVYYGPNSSIVNYNNCISSFMILEVGP